MKAKLMSMVGMLMAVLLTVPGCAVGPVNQGESEAQPVTPELVRSDKQRVTSPNVSETDLALLVDGNSAFAFNLYHALKEGNGNIFYSPHSISLVLAMTYAGAGSETAEQMADTLHFMLPESRLHPAFNSLDIELSQRGEGAEGKDGEGFRLNIVNAIWGKKDYQFLAEFLDLLAENYGAGLRLLDFENAPEESRIIINDWVSDQTEGRIKDLIPQGLIDPTTRLVLTNAIYFNVAWQYAFDEDMTADGPFYLLDGTEVTAPMMRQTRTFDYTEGNGYQAVKLPYDSGELSMVVLLPQAGRFESFEGSLDAQQASEIVGKLERKRVALTMPRLEFESSFCLMGPLAAMGMSDAFVWPIANFSGMSNDELFILDVVHKAFVSVDEAGTEAAAATAVVMPPTAQPQPSPKPIEVTIDHPFIFLIRDIETGAILFVGRVMNPTA